MHNILITAPSLDENCNVSGISSIVREIVKNQSRYKQIHFQLGWEDNKKKHLGWLFQQIIIIPKSIYAVIKYKVDIIHFNTGFEKASLIRDYSIFLFTKYLLRKKNVLHIHGGSYLMKPTNKLIKYIIKSFIKSSDSVIVLSSIEKNKIFSDYNFNDCKVLPNVVDYTKAIPRATTTKSNKVKICFLGRVVTSKGIFQIIESFKKISSIYHLFEFNIYGTGPQLGDFLKGLQECNGLDYTYHGVVKGDAKWMALKENDIFLLPSIYGEGLPIAMLEAMASKCIVIVSNDASITSVVTHNVNGIVLNNSDPEILSFYIQDIVSKINHYSFMSDNAFNTVKNNFTIKNYMFQLEEIYAELSH